MKNKKIIYGGLIIILLIISYFGYGFVKIKTRKVQLGLAQPTFPFRDYSEKELNKLFQQIKYADVPTRVTPEETYAKFRQALGENNLEMAIDQLAKDSKRYEENVKMLKNFFNDKKFKKLSDYYPNLIKQINIYQSLSQYEFEYYSQEYKQNLVGSLDFIKNQDGDWKLDTL